MAKSRPVNKAGKPNLYSLPEIGQYRTDTARGLQMEILRAYAQLSRSWLARVQSEAALWANLGTKVASSRSLSEIIEAQKKCVSDQIQMTVEDGQHLLNDCETITRQICEMARGGSSTADVKQPRA